MRSGVIDTPQTIQENAELCWKRGKRLETLEINSVPGNPFNILSDAHPVLILGLRETGHPTQQVFHE
ncbi:MAG TPA: hypothetical protein V6D29_09820 [Leptolyngbyaceae cyanobacterium]